MEENYQGYNQPEYENDDPRKGANKSILGYRIVIIILAVILAAITVLYYNIHRQQQADYDLLVIDRDSIQNNLSDLMQDFDDLQLSNDTLSLQMGIERQRADSLMQRLKQERSWSLAKIKQYEKEVGTLRTIMRGYLHQIDSLNTLNKKLIDENVSYRKEITTAQMRAEMAEEKAQELNNKVRQGSVINARGIRMVALNARSKEVSRIKNAERLRVDFTLTANALATPGEKTIYVRILSPDGYVLSSESVPTFEFEGERLSYSASRDVDYQNEDLNIGIFYTGSGFTAGTYQVQICAGGPGCGPTEQLSRKIRQPPGQQKGGAGLGKAGRFLSQSGLRRYLHLESATIPARIIRSRSERKRRGSRHFEPECRWAAPSRCPGKRAANSPPGNGASVPTGAPRLGPGRRRRTRLRAR